MIIKIQNPTDILYIRETIDMLQKQIDDMDHERHQHQTRIDRDQDWNSKYCENFHEIYEEMKRIERFISLTKQVLPVKSELPDNCKQFDFKTVHVNGNGKYIDESISSFCLGSWECNCCSWVDLVKYVCEILYIEHENDFVDIVKTIYGERRGNYFSQRKTSLVKPYKINHEWFVETNFSANNAVSLVQMMASKFGYQPIQIYLH